MKEFFKLLSSPLPEFSDDPISNCANNLKNLERLKASYPHEEKKTTALCINLKA